NELGSADVSIVLQISAHWQAIVTGALSELQTQAKIMCLLVTRHTLQSDVISLVFSVRNSGRGAAINLRINLLAGPEYTLLNDAADLPQLPPGAEEQVTLRIRPQKDQDLTEFRVRFVVHYEDPLGPNQSEHFADIVQLVSEPASFEFISNPYVAGTPLMAGSALFFGREDLVAAIQENLAAAHRNNLVIIGQRRMGKTSLLKQLNLRLGSDYLLVYLDGQVIGLDPGLPNFFLNLATEITFALEDQGISIPPPALEHFESSPAGYFEHDFLANVIRVLENRQLIILFDEFEELEQAVVRGHLDAAIFGYLRHLMQHIPGLSFIFCGTHRLEELTIDYWNVLFNISLYHRISYLAYEDAMRLVQEPVDAFGMKYDDLALDKMWRITAGHPYFLQLLCHSLVNWHNKTQHNYVTIADVNSALDEILTAGEAHFIYLWTESTPEERLALVAMSRMAPLTGSVQSIQLVDFLAERGIQADRKAIREALYHLVLRDILSMEEIVSGGENVFLWRLGLVGLWVEKFKSLARVLDEAAA
ncbi:MAG TPA: AAA family ATPase, partial [Anaerolineales bacterium]|nr:AAA family ATPase [Anaerolineales bacterium]